MSADRVSVTVRSDRSLRWWGCTAVAAVAIGLALRASTALACAGDCNGDGTVEINELVIGVDIALGQTLVAACPAMDSNGDGSITIDELIAAVNNALDNCGMSRATPTAPPISDVKGGSQAAVYASAAAQQPLVFSFGYVGGAGSERLAGRSAQRDPRDMALLGRAGTGAPAGMARQALADCLNPGGTEQTECVETADGYLFSVAYVQCESVESGSVDVVRDGEVQVLGPPEVCQPVTLAGLNLTFSLTQYTVQETDPNGIVTTSTWGRDAVFTDAHAQSDQLGCDGQPFISESLGGDFSIHVAQGAAVYLDRQYTYDEFVVATGMGYFTSPTVCQSGLLVNGTFTLADQLTGTKVSQTFGTPGQSQDSFFIFAGANPDGSVSVNEHGRISSSCFGDVPDRHCERLAVPVRRCGMSGWRHLAGQPRRRHRRRRAISSERH